MQFGDQYLIVAGSERNRLPESELFGVVNTRRNNRSGSFANELRQLTRKKEFELDFDFGA